MLCGDSFNKSENIILKWLFRSVANSCKRKHEKYKGSRPKRGCFKTSTGRKVNADVNSACNIMKKYLLKVAGNCMNLLHELVEVFSTPCLKIKTF